MHDRWHIHSLIMCHLRRWCLFLLPCTVCVATHHGITGGWTFRTERTASCWHKTLVSSESKVNTPNEKIRFGRSISSPSGDLQLCRCNVFLFTFSAPTIKNSKKKTIKLEPKIGIVKVELQNKYIPSLKRLAVIQMTLTEYWPLFVGNHTIVM